MCSSDLVDDLAVELENGVFGFFQVLRDLREIGVESHAEIGAGGADAGDELVTRHLSSKVLNLVGTI